MFDVKNIMDTVVK